MFNLEVIVFLVSIYFTFKVFIGWYVSLNQKWPSNRNRKERLLLGLLPVFSLVIIIYVLNKLASFDVVDSMFYQLVYIFLGFAWLGFGLRLMAKFFDLSWRDDALELNNNAALYTVMGGFLGLTLIYSGANIGDGPGWWCVVFAGALGLITWFILTIFINKFTHIFDRITVERNTPTGIRIGFYLLASGIILGRAVSGDWTSASATIWEFRDGWPVLILTLLVLVIENLYRLYEQKEETIKYNVFGSFLWGLIYVLIAILCVTLIPPLKENPIYDLVIGGLM
ncbi:MAG: hypothetical protein K0Q49_429 [Haloplasmataceae bacterium]|nr:hypothetical protein [Haloplasmataceae bacterium]